MTHEMENPSAPTLLTDQSRQFVMHYIRMAEAPVSLRTLAERLVDWEADRRGVPASEIQKREAYAWLLTIHVPRLDEHGLVKFDEHAGTVSPL